MIREPVGRVSGRHGPAALGLAGALLAGCAGPTTPPPSASPWADLAVERGLDPARPLTEQTDAGRRMELRRAIRGACAASPFCAGCAPTPERRSEVAAHKAWEQEIATEMGVPAAGATNRFCQRLAAGVADGRITFADLDAVLHGPGDPAYAAANARMLAVVAAAPRS